MPTEWVARTLGKGKEERRPFVDIPFCPHASTVSFDDALHRRESDAATLEVTVVEPLKGIKQLL